MMNWEHLSPHEKQTRRQSRDTLPLALGFGEALWTEFSPARYVQSLKDTAGK